MVHRLSWYLTAIVLAVPLIAIAPDTDISTDESAADDIPSAELVVSFNQSVDEKFVEDAENSRAPKSRNAIFYAIAAGDLEAVRQIIIFDEDALNRAYEYKATEKSFDGFHSSPYNGDTPLIYLVKTIIDLHKAYDSRKFSDEFTIQLAFEHRFTLVSEILFHPKTISSGENADGHTAVTLAAQAGLVRLANLLSSGTHPAPKQTDVSQFKARLAKLDVSAEVRKRINAEIDVLGQKHPAERGLQINFINALLDLPWDKTADTAVDIATVQEALESEHYALKKVKDAVLDYLAVASVSQSLGKSKIICLVGPPGTGKTSVVQSIARGLNRPLAKVCLGGAHDESVIRGHNKSYISATPGEIIKGIIHAKVRNPVILLDEIDKIGTSQYNGNPSSALLEVLDPEQNHSFIDRFVEVPFDLSECLFIATANSKREIPLPLLDRLEIIEVPGYSLEEKVQIAQNYLVPKIIREATSTELIFDIGEDVIRSIIKNYTFESGVRKLTQHLKTLFAKTARQYLDKRTVPIITPENLTEYLGPSFNFPRLSQAPAVGIVNCLSVSPGFGGATSFLEVVLVPNGKGDLKVSKVLENDSENAAAIALAYVRSHAQELGISASQLSSNDIHVHKPGIGHVDGPSAGIANVTAMVSAFTNKLCDPTYAMTGELSLTGKVMAIGGLKEKILAAKREGIKKVIIPRENESELYDFKQLLDGIEIIPVSDVREVLSKVLLPNSRKR